MSKTLWQELLELQDATMLLKTCGNYEDKGMEEGCLASKIDLIIDDLEIIKIKATGKDEKGFTEDSIFVSKKDRN